VHVINQLFRELVGRIDDAEKKIPPHNHLKSTSTLVFGTIPANSAVEATVYVGGAHTSGVAHASPGQGVDIGNSNLIWSARVGQQNQIRVRVLNPTNAPVVVNTIPWNIFVLQ